MSAAFSNGCLVLCIRGVEAAYQEPLLFVKTSLAPTIENGPYVLPKDQGSKSDPFTEETHIKGSTL